MAQVGSSLKVRSKKTAEVVRRSQGPPRIKATQGTIWATVGHTTSLTRLSN